MKESLVLENPELGSLAWDDNLDKPLARLLLANRVRELADFPRPVTVQDLGHLGWLFSNIAKLVYSAVGRLPKQKSGVWKRILSTALDGMVLVAVRSILERGRVWRIARGIIRALIHVGVSGSVRYHARPTSEITAFVTSGHREEPLIRVCLLLRIMRRYGACIELLVRRLKSGLPAHETQRWLAFFLAEVNDQKASNILVPSNGRPQAAEYVQNHLATNGSYPNGRTRSTLRYGVILPTMFDSDVFRRSLLSLLHSDFQGEIVVVEEGNQPEKVCESFCSQLPITYVKNPTWTGTMGVANLGIESLAQQTDIMIMAHSDLLWPPRWFDQLDRAWGQVFDLDKVGSIHMGVMEIYRTTDPVLSDLFLQGKYEDLIWVLDAMRESPALMGSIADLQTNSRDRGNLFGLSISHWDGGVPNFCIGDSVLASFPRRTWSSMGGFDEEMGVGIGPELAYHDLSNRKWGLRINNTPVIHLARSDTGRDVLAPEDRARLDQIISRFAPRYEEKHGWDYTHLSLTYHAETLVHHSDEVTAAVNELRFSDIDYIFDEFFERLNTKTLSDCELTMCPKRTSCKYV